MDLKIAKGGSWDYLTLSSQIKAPNEKRSP